MAKKYDTDPKDTSNETTDDTIEFEALPEDRKAPEEEQSSASNGEDLAEEDETSDSVTDYVPVPEEKKQEETESSQKTSSDATPAEDLKDLPDAAKGEDLAEDTREAKEEPEEKEVFEIDTIEDPLSKKEGPETAEAKEDSKEASETAEPEKTAEKSSSSLEDIEQILPEITKEEVPEKKGLKLRGPKWFRYATKGVKIAVTVILCLALFVVGFFTYEYNRLQKADPNAYTDKNVQESVAKDATDETLKLSEQAMEDQLSGVGESEAVASDDAIFQDDNVYNILLIGTDDRTEKFSSDARGDTCILLSLNKSTGKVSLISFERGTGVPILWGPYEGQWDWLTHSFRYGGADMMVAEIRENFRVDVNRYIRINIRTLVKLIDAIGGIEVDGVTEAEANHINHPEGTITEGLSKGIGVQDDVLELKEGTNHMNGATAMVYARMRYIDDDWHRVVRQRKVIEAAANKLSELSATEMISTLDQIVPLVQTDLSETEVAELITLAPKFMSAEVQDMTIPADGTYGSMRGMGDRPMFAVDFDKNTQIIRDMLYGTTDEETATEDSTAASSDDSTSGTDSSSGTESSEEVTESSTSDTSEDLADTPYGNPFNSDTRTYNTIKSSYSSSSGSSSSSSKSSYYYTGNTGGDDDSIGQLVESSTTGASQAASSASTDTTTGTSQVSSVLNADGSVTTKNADGSTTVTSTDGTITTVTQDGRTVKTDATGTTVIAYPDGTMETTTADGTKTVTPGSGSTASSDTTATTTTTDTTTTDASSSASSLDTSGMSAEQAAQYQAQYEQQLAAQQAAAAQYAAEVAAQQAAAAASGN